MAQSLAATTLPFIDFARSSGRPALLMSERPRAKSRRDERARSSALDIARLSSHVIRSRMKP